MSKTWLLSLALLTSFHVYANKQTNRSKDINAPSPWQSQIEFGYQAHSGNTDSEALNTRVKGEYTRGRHRTNGEWRFYKLDKNGKENKRQSSYSLQSDYKLGPKTYLYGSFRGSDSRYSAYFSDYTWSGGLGYQFTHTDDLLIELEVGPGYRYQEPNLDKISSGDVVFPHLVKEPIYRGNLKVEWQALSNFKLLTDLTLVGGESNTRFDSDISIINNITDDIALKVSQSRQYHNRVPTGLSKADSVLSVSLIFLF
ncbi:DUF481 domain-containing protein [Vibrio metschnikovii]|uniref:DUF481 domain-containing protein n=1 Tax=Vibrio TaxID=662 RepID=UPI000935363F|nr:MULTISPECIES: DUF481 domain-containing protein [Vibrio]EKO3722422.1 DUF481 domain-containing protein [Vibrio metschnikovii]EKO3726073.1 DUF481 domain-containing protein [Vibrio metschnikovii]EKO3736789.1 DUF481 domain-containing protein [Vibrio metschnikovii]EKO3747019.1 DUF481 domain-containing protein [Vibrio metschnikovii]EKO3881264.1 DUF481 domain-containing protein [Vibrio metschnikovii]